MITLPIYDLCQENRNKWKYRITKVVLQNLDGTQHEVKLTFPYLTSNGEMQELTHNYLSGLIDHWSKFWIKIKSYQIFFGSIDNKDNEVWNLDYPPFEIPLNKVFVPNKNYASGTWEKPETILKKQTEKIFKK